MNTPRTPKIFVLPEDLIERLAELTEKVLTDEGVQVYRGTRDRLRIHRRVTKDEVAACGGDKALVEEIRAAREEEASRAEAVLQELHESGFERTPSLTQTLSTILRNALARPDIFKEVCPDVNWEALRLPGHHAPEARKHSDVG